MNAKIHIIFYTNLYLNLEHFKVIELHKGIFKTKATLPLVQPIASTSRLQPAALEASTL
jgi:hypothetical protein